MMPNPYLPNWEYIPDGEPRVFGERVYIYGSHDRVDSEYFCDYKLKVWSASIIPTVEMTSLGFSQSLNPYAATPADTACVLKGGALITELDLFTRIITNVTDGCVMGWKYYDFGKDYTNEDILFAAKLLPRGCHGRIRICIDNETEEIGSVEFFHNSTEVKGKVKNVTGRHAVYLIAESGYTTWAKDGFQGRQLFDLVSFVFCK